MKKNVICKGKFTVKVAVYLFIKLLKPLKEKSSKISYVYSRYLRDIKKKKNYAKHDTKNSKYEGRCKNAELLE